MQALTCTLAPRCWWTPTTGTSGQPLGKLDIKLGKTGHPLGCWTTSLCNLSSMSRFGLYDHSGNANWGGLASWLATISTHLTILWKQNEQKRCPHCACNGLLRTLWHDLHKCLFSRLFARIFFGKPGLLPSREDGGDGSCEAIIPPSNVGDPRRVFRERPQWNNTAVVGSSDALFFVKSLKYAPTGVKMMSVHTHSCEQLPPMTAENAYSSQGLLEDAASRRRKLCLTLDGAVWKLRKTASTEYQNNTKLYSTKILNMSLMMSVIPIDMYIHDLGFVAKKKKQPSWVAMWTTHGITLWVSKDLVIYLYAL